MLNGCSHNHFADMHMLIWDDLRFVLAVGRESTLSAAAEAWG